MLISYNNNNNIIIMTLFRVGAQLDKSNLP